MDFQNSFSNFEAKIKESPNRGSFHILQKEVVDSGKCIRCGTCVSICNYNALSWDKVLNKPTMGGENTTGRCIACGVCYHQCPQSNASEKSVIGQYSKHFIAKSKILKGQDGGTTNSLLYHMFEKNLIDAAVVTKKLKDPLWHPEAIIITKKEELKGTEGSIYAHSKVSAKLIEAVQQGLKKIAVVGCPCKSKAIDTLINAESSIFGNNEELKIYNVGLFCMEAFMPDKLHTLLETKDIELDKVSKMDFSGGKFRIFYKEGEDHKEFATFSISSLHEAIESSCKICDDFTAEFADISIGSVGAPDGYNMILARNDEMAGIIDEMISKELIETMVVEKKQLRTLLKISQNKKDKTEKVETASIEYHPEKFNTHHPSEWNMDNYNYSATINQEHYKKADSKETVINKGEGDPVFVAKTPNGSKEEMTKFQYASSYDLTKKLLEKFGKVNDGKILIKPNNTGFVGVFKHDALAEILKQNGITDNADHQPIATQPAIMAGMVDALLELGAKEIHIGENMLWNGGVERAFYETGYCEVFKDKKYRNKVFFIDFYENDPPTNCLEKIELKKTSYCKTDYYDSCYPPKALFAEKYDLILISSVAKSHNCAFYTLSNKNFSVSWNPRKKTGKIEPRWHIHGMPADVFKPETIKEILGKDFKRKNKIFVREVYRHRWNFKDKQRVVKPKKSQLILSNNLMSSGLLNHFKSFGNDVLDVDPHHWTGINIGLLTLGMGYLINRYTRMFGAIINKLKDQGTPVGVICSGIVGQEGDGPLAYGKTKYGGFNAASFDHTAIERVVTDIMYGESEGGYCAYLKKRQAERMKLHKIECPELIDEIDNLWTFRIMHDLIGGNFEINSIPITLLNYTNDSKYDSIKPTQVYSLREGLPFRSSLGYYCNPDLWLKLLHNNESLYMQMFLIEMGSIVIPLIPGVVG
jgi:coenzyme F420 hydrogenase subunit beta